MEITKLGLLLELRDYYDFKLGLHTTSYTRTDSKPGHETHFSENKQKLAILDALILEAEGADEV